LYVCIGMYPVSNFWKILLILRELDIIVISLEVTQRQVLKECCRIESTSEFSSWLLDDDNDDDDDDDDDDKGGDDTFNMKLSLIC
jgi:hypothetical protein